MNPRQQLIEDIAGFYSDPLGYVFYNFPWGQPGILRDHNGPRDWQRGFLRELGEDIRGRGFDGINPVQPIETSASSGHGTGKSALSAWLIKFIHDTRPYSKGIVTANTADQLRTKTWAELGKWHKMSLTQDWAYYSSGKGSMNLVNVEHPESWRVDALTCREENSEAFAGLHAANSTPFYLFDEASAIPDAIWEVSDGGLTDGEPMRFSFGNPTRASGRFRENFGRRRHLCRTYTIDSRLVEGTNKELFRQWEELYGEDSDFFRVRVRGLPPNASSTQFIGSDIVTEAGRREAKAEQWEPAIVGVDVARFGDDQSVIRTRHGRDARTFRPKRFRGIDTMQLSSHVMAHVADMKRQGFYIGAVFVDGVGVGGGVVDRLRALGLDVIDVNAGSRADDQRFHNKRAEMWDAMRQWLKEGGCIDPKDAELHDELTTIEYGFSRTTNKLILESKDDMKKRGLASPDNADALALTFAYPVFAHDVHPIGGAGVVSEYNPLDAA